MLVYCEHNHINLQLIISNDINSVEVFDANTKFIGIDLINNWFVTVNGTGCSFDLTYDELLEVFFEHSLVKFTEERLDLYIEMLWQRRLNKVTPTLKEINHETQPR